MRRTSSGAPRGRPRKKDKNTTLVAEETPVWLSDEGPIVYDPFPITTCSVCGGIDDEDLIILCDGPGCTNEIHMYCLTPVITAVPEGDWFCEACDTTGSTVQLRKYFEDFSSYASEILSFAPDYTAYIILLQQRQLPLRSWRPAMVTDVIRSEFDASAVDLIGCIVRVSIGNSRQHTGRIINRRLDVGQSRWEHKVQFRSGAEGRNVQHTQWMRLDEHPCMVGYAVKWVRSADAVFWPALEFLQSGVKLAATIHSDTSSRSSTSTADKRLYYLFAEEKEMTLVASDTRFVVPFFAKSKETRLYLGKRPNVAYALATAEREEMQTARRVYSLQSRDNAKINDGTLVSGCTTGYLKGLAEAHTRIINPKATTAPTFTASDPANSESIVSNAMPIGQGEGTAKQDAWSISRGCHLQMLRSEYCRSVASNLSELEAAQTATDGESAETIVAKGEEIGRGAELDGVVGLDRALLTVESGLDPRNVHSSRESSAVLFHFGQVNTSELSVSASSTPTAAKRKRASASQADEVPAVKKGSSLELKTFRVGEIIFEKYKADINRKKDEIIARQVWEEQERERERVERAAARKAREAKFEVNPWFADGEDFTRKSSRLSRTARPSYLEAEDDGMIIEQLTEEATGAHAEELSEPEVTIQQKEEVDAAEILVDVKPTKKKSARGEARRNKKIAQEETEFQDYLQSTADQPRLLSDIDRDTWIGTTVTYVVNLQMGRVVEYRSGWAVVQTASGPISCRPYQLEVIAPSTLTMDIFEDARPLQEEAEKPQNVAREQSPGDVGVAAIDPFVFTDASEVLQERDDGLHVDAVGLDENDLMYNAFVNDEEYEAFLLDQFDPSADMKKGAEGRRQGAAAGRQQQLKPSRTKFLESVPLSEEEKKKRLAALTKKREQAQQLLRGQKLSASSGPSARVITMKRASEGIDDAEIVVPQKVPLKATNSNARNGANAGGNMHIFARDAPVRDAPHNKPFEVMKLGTAPALAKPGFHRESGNNYRRAVTDLPRRLSLDAPPERRDFDRRASLPAPKSFPKDAYGRDRRPDRENVEGVTAKDGADNARREAAERVASDVIRTAEREAENAKRAAELEAASTKRAQDPRIRMRTEREGPHYDGHQEEQRNNSTGPQARRNQGTRDTDYRSMKNASADVRTAKANIDYLQAQYLIESSQSPASSEALSHSTAPARRVNFGAVTSSIGASIIDADVLKMTGDDDRGYFSPVSGDEEEEGPRAHSRVNVDSTAHYEGNGQSVVPPRPRVSRFSDITPHTSAAQSLTSGDKQSDSPPAPRRSRFAPSIVTDESAAVLSVSSTTNASQMSLPSVEPMLTQLERRRLKRQADLPAAADSHPDLEPGEVPSKPNAALLKKARKDPLPLPSATSTSTGRIVVVNDSTSSGTTSVKIVQPTGKNFLQSAKRGVPIVAGASFANKAATLMLQPPKTVGADRPPLQFNNNTKVNVVMPQTVDTQQVEPAATQSIVRKSRFSSDTGGLHVQGQAGAAVHTVPQQIVEPPPFYNGVLQESQYRGGQAAPRKSASPRGYDSRTYYEAPPREEYHTGRGYDDRAHYEQTFDSRRYPAEYDQRNANAYPLQDRNFHSTQARSTSRDRPAYNHYGPRPDNYHN